MAAGIGPREDRETAMIERQIRPALAEAGLIPARAAWTPLSGGRTNKVWRVSAGGEDLVCKYSVKDSSNPLFPNFPESEYRCLRDLSGSGLLPELRGRAGVPGGVALVYGFVPGDRWRAGAADVARLLSCLHQLPPPRGLRRPATGSSGLREHALGILGLCRSPCAAWLASLEPRCGRFDGARRCLVHGDPVPGNILRTGGRLVLIDWQCPAAGDAADDIACFLSPAMQLLYGSGPLDAAERAAFLAAYGDQRIAARYLGMETLFHWRMAAYCLWRVETGSQEYREAMKAEVSALRARRPAPDSPARRRI